MSIAARRAVVRWSWRLFRREWRQQLLVLVLLTITVAGAVFGAVAARSLTPSSDGDFGSASHRLQFAELRQPALADNLAAVEDWFGTVDVIATRQAVVPGTLNTIELRSQDPTGAYGAPMLALRSGRYPAGTEVAVTSKMSSDLQVTVGGHLDVDGVDRAVVGIVENPGDLDDQFALLAPGDPEAVSLTVLVRTTEDRIRALPGDVPLSLVDSRGQDEATVAAVAALSLAVVVAILVCLVAAAGFVVLAQRRLRQLGMLAAIGATERHLRLVVVANGALVGTVSAVTGAVLAGVAWIVASPALESAAAHRLDRFDVPWWIVASGMVLAVATATVAAWWPGRAIARVPITRALSGRPPQPESVHRSAVLAILLIGLGFAGLAVGLDVVADEANVAFILPGIAALVIGMLLFSPVAIRGLAPIANRAPIAVRLALRDLARHQARSGVALAAIALSLGLALSTVIIAGAAEHQPTEGNLSDRQLMVRYGDREPVIPELTEADVARRRDLVERLAATLSATVVPLEVALSPGLTETRDGISLRPFVVLGRPVGNVTRDIGVLYVATPELARHLGIDLDEVRPDTDVLTPHPGEVEFANVKRPPDDPVVDALDTPAYSSAPTSVLTIAALDRYGWEAAPAAWLIEASAPLTDDQITEARDLAVDAGLAIETRDEQEGLRSVQTGATAVGMGLALAVLAMTVGLIRGEATADLQALTAAGASSGTRRAIVAATAGALAVLGVVIGGGGAYLALIASYLEDLHPLTQVPTAHLLATAVGVPLAAAGTGWLLAGREPQRSRTALE